METKDSMESTDSLNSRGSKANDLLQEKFYLPMKELSFGVMQWLLF